MNSVDKGVHKAASKTKTGAKKTGKKIKDESKEGYDKAMAPANKPNS